MRNERVKNSELKFKKFQIAKINTPGQLIGIDGDVYDNTNCSWV